MEQDRQDHSRAAFAAEKERVRIIDECLASKPAQKEQANGERFKWTAEERELEKRALEKTMRDRLAQFGFPEGQIKAMGNADRQKKLEEEVGSTPHNPSLPTYAKIRREYLDIETLYYYNLPYEDDKDPNYIIVLQEMTQKEADVLFNHTRRRRSDRGHGKQKDSGIRADGDDQPRSRSNEKEESSNPPKKIRARRS